MAEQTKAVKWTDLVPVLAIAVTQAPTPEERAGAMKELMHLASIVDHHIGNLETLKEEQKPQGNIICPDCGVRGSHAFGCPLASTQLKVTDNVCVVCGSVNLGACGEPGCPYGV